jgi:uncharacterized damage-inducible protein DinB
MKPPKHLNIRAFLETLERTPSMMLEFSQGLTDAQLRTSPARDSWSMLDVLWHLRGCDAVWVESIEKMLLENTPTIAYQHPNDWWKLNLVKTAEYFEILEEFRLKRDSLLKRLRGLNQEDWLRNGFIKAREYSIYSQIRRLALHETRHEKQFSSLRAWLLER